MLKGVEIVGLRTFAKKLRAADTTLATELRLGLKDIAGVVADGARPQVPTRTGALRRSLRPTSSAKTAEVRMGGARVPYAGFIEFGGAVGRDKSVKRTFIKAGRYLRPTYEKRRPQVQARAVQLIDRVASRLN